MDNFQLYDDESRVIDYVGVTECQECQSQSTYTKLGNHPLLTRLIIIRFGGLVNQCIVSCQNPVLAAQKFCQR